MNERIKDLVLQRGFARYDDEIEKLCLLIINECASHISDNTDRYRKDYFANTVLEHFGLKECQ